jgi:hypothetical protein
MVEVGREQVADATQESRESGRNLPLHYPRAGRAAEPVPARILRPSTLKERHHQYHRNVRDSGWRRPRDFQWWGGIGILDSEGV